VSDLPVEAYLGRALPGRLDCVVDANPPVSQVVWTKNERPLSLPAPAHAAGSGSGGGAVRRVHVDRGGSLIFAVVRSVDEGRYACAAYSSLGAGRSSTTVRVYVRGRRYSLSTKLNTRKKGSPYSITERRVPELIPVLGSQPAGYVSHKPGGRLPLLSARTAVTPASLRRAATNFAAC